MTHKQLVLIDICGRLPYGVKVHGIFLNYNKDKDKILYEECDKELNYKDLNHLNRYESLKPYLRSMSSMTEEEKSQYNFYLTRIVNGYDASKLIDWLNKKGFDYRGLIEQDLALAAPEGMYK